MISLPGFTSRRESHGQPHQRTDAEAFAPRDRPFRCGEANIWKAREDPFEGDRRFHPRELKAKAEMRAGSERQVRVRVPRNVEVLGIRES